MLLVLFVYWGITEEKEESEDLKIKVGPPGVRL